MTTNSLGWSVRAIKLLGILACAMFAACSDPLGPQAVVGTYVLQGVAGEALPAHLHSNEDVSIHVLAETIHFDANGQGTLNTVREIQYVNGAPPERFNGVWEFGYKIIGQRIEVEYDCPDNALCVDPPHLVLRVTADELYAVFALGARTPLTYSRLLAPEL